MTMPPDIQLHPGISAMVRGEHVVIRDNADTVMLKFTEAHALFTWLDGVLREQKDCLVCGRRLRDHCEIDRNKCAENLK